MGMDVYQHDTAGVSELVRSIAMSVVLWESSLAGTVAGAQGTASYSGNQSSLFSPKSSYSQEHSSPVTKEQVDLFGDEGRLAFVLADSWTL